MRVNRTISNIPTRIVLQTHALDYEKDIKFNFILEQM